MPIMDIFNQDPFRAIELTAAVERTPFNPVGLGQLNIFEPVPIYTTALAVEERDGKLVVIPTSTRGKAPTERVTERRKARWFDVPRLAHADTLMATELQNVREFGTESVLMQVQTELARRLSGPTGLQASMEYTWERHRLAAIQGQLIDADDSVLFDWFTEFGIDVPAEVAFNLAANTAGTLRPICAAIVRGMARAAKGAFGPTTKVYGLCGDEFWDDFTTHTDVEKTFLNWNAAEDLRRGTAFQSMRFADIEWFNYRGSDDGSTISVAPDKVKFFPVGAPGVFRTAYAPAEFAPFVNTRGRPLYVIPVMDRDREAWFRSELYSYPLHICTRPEVLRSGRAGA